LLLFLIMLWLALPVVSGQAAQKSGDSQTPVHLSNVEDRIWRLTNDVRRQHGLSSLSRQKALAAVSQAYSTDMLVRRFFSHTNPEGLDAGDRLKPLYSGPIYAWAENIWEGSNISTADPDRLAHTIMDSWMSSPGHRENILNPKYTHLGIGVAASGREVRATQLFARLQPD
jgi:uncharacterized protein YkwD